MKKIRLIIIEDNKLLREGIRGMFKTRKDIMVVAATGDRIKVRDKIRELKPNVLLLDLGLVNLNSLKLVRSIKKQFPNLKMIVMDLLPIQTDIKQFIDEGVSGFILKDASIEEFMNTIRSVAKGNKIFPSQMHGSLFSEIVDNAVDELMSSKLVESIRMTEKEKKIIGFISAGVTDKEIAQKLNTTKSIVKSHIDNILEKMSLSTRVQIAIYRNSGEDYITTSGIKPKKPKTIREKRTKLTILRDGTYNGKRK
ncbi:MAG TPA: response regulator transcription factor [Ignavibacteria bacterium]|nr:response regulator transcription factor [Ignavibacteria bacterium]